MEQNTTVKQRKVKKIVQHEFVENFEEQKVS